MSALAWTLRVTVSVPTKVAALGVKRTVREFDWANAEDPRPDEQATSTRTSTAWRARRVSALLVRDIRAMGRRNTAAGIARFQVMRFGSATVRRKSATRVSLAEIR